jgi:hypothetical protein
MVLLPMFTRRSLLSLLAATPLAKLLKLTPTPDKGWTEIPLVELPPQLGLDLNRSQVLAYKGGRVIWIDFDVPAVSVNNGPPTCDRELIDSDFDHRFAEAQQRINAAKPGDMISVDQDLYPYLTWTPAV